MPVSRQRQAADELSGIAMDCGHICRQNVSCRSTLELRLSVIRTTCFIDESCALKPARDSCPADTGVPALAMSRVEAARSSLKTTSCDAGRPRAWNGGSFLVIFRSVC